MYPKGTHPGMITIIFWESTLRLARHLRVQVASEKTFEATLPKQTVAHGAMWGGPSHRCPQGSKTGTRAHVLDVAADQMQNVGFPIC